MLQILIGGEEHFEHFLISKPEQIAVPGATPALLVNRRDYVSLENRVEAPECLDQREPAASQGASVCKLR
jgi:hypothetical protein